MTEEICSVHGTEEESPGHVIELACLVDDRMVLLEKANAIPSLIQAKAKEFLNSAGSEKEMLSRAAFLYWHIPEVKARTIAEVVFGHPSNPQKLAASLPTAPSINVTCKGCKCEFPFRILDVHHRTYERRGAEWQQDLIVLCRDRHRKFHDKL